MLVVYNIHDCDDGLRTLREHATYYGEVQADIELLPYDINGDDGDDIKRAVYLIIMNPLPCGLGVKMLSVQEPHEVFPDSYDLEDPEELAWYEREVHVGEPIFFLSGCLLPT